MRDGRSMLATNGWRAGDVAPLCCPACVGAGLWRLHAVRCWLIIPNNTFKREIFVYKGLFVRFYQKVMPENFYPIILIICSF